MLRARQRADEEPLRLNENWVTACCILLMWNTSAVGISYLVCTKFGKPWWQDNWWVAAVILVAVMVLAEVVWVARTILSERHVGRQSDKQTPLILESSCTQAGDEQPMVHVDV